MTDIKTNTQPKPHDKAAVDSQHDLIVLANGHCDKAQKIADFLTENGLEFHHVDLDADGDARRTYGVYFNDGMAKAPAIVIKGKAFRNPNDKELVKRLARAGLYDAGLVHDEHSQRFIRYLMPADGFASYIWRGETMVLTHIEVHPSTRGTGLGGRLAGEIFEAVMKLGHPAQLSCPFLRKVAASKPKWADYFLS